MDLVTYALLKKYIKKVAGSGGLLDNSNELPSPVEGVSTLVASTKYFLGEQVELNIAFPKAAAAGEICNITFKSGATPTVLTIDESNTVGDNKIICESNFTYEINGEYNGENWVIQYLMY